MPDNLHNNAFSFGMGFATVAGFPIALAVAHVTGATPPALLKPLNVA